MASSSANRSAGMIGVPLASAFVSFEAPAPSPTTSANVFLDTLPGLLPLPLSTALILRVDSKEK